MPSPEEIKQRIEASIPGAHAEVEDYTGGGDHFRATVTARRLTDAAASSSTASSTRCSSSEIGGAIHALALKTQTPPRDPDQPLEEPPCQPPSPSQSATSRCSTADRGRPTLPSRAGEPDSTSNPIRDAIRDAIAEHKVILFMKGTPEAPACGFSARTVAALQALDTPFAAVDVLPDPRIREELSAISDWPTIPQLFANGELVGGCDIVTEMYESGELAQVLV